MTIQYLILSSGSGIVVQLSDICFIKASDNGSIIHLKDGSQVKEWKRLKHIAQILEGHQDFFQVHRSYIVNKKYLKIIHANSLFLSDTYIIPIGITVKEKVHLWVEKNKK